MGNKLFTIVLLLATVPPLVAQGNQKLHDFLWKTEFNTLIDRFAEETVELVDEGEHQARIRALPYTIEEGWRVQVFAGTNREYARALALKLRALKLDSVYVVQSDQLYKVQVGNFTERPEAEKLLNRLWYAGIDNAWIVKTPIHVLKKPLPVAASAAMKPTELSGRIAFAIQIFATGDPQKADSMKILAGKKLGLKTRTLAAANGWKVLVGEFKEEADARHILNLVKRNGFPDAWITQIEITKR